MDTLLFANQEDVSIDDAKSQTRQIAPHFQKLGALLEEMKGLLKVKTKGKTKERKQDVPLGVRESG